MVNEASGEEDGRQLEARRADGRTMPPQLKQSQACLPLRLGPPRTRTGPRGLILFFRLVILASFKFLVCLVILPQVVSRHFFASFRTVPCEAPIASIVLQRIFFMATIYPLSIVPHQDQTQHLPGVENQKTESFSFVHSGSGWPWEAGN
jgi:hypothetical protein